MQADPSPKVQFWALRSLLIDSNGEGMYHCLITISKLLLNLMNRCIRGPLGLRIGLCIEVEGYSGALC